MLQTTSLQQVKIWSYARADLVLRWALKVNVILHIITFLSAFADIFQRADGVQPESWARSIAAKTFLFLCFRSHLPQDTFVSLFRCKQRPLSNRLSQTEQSQCSQLLFTTLTVSSSWFNPVVTWLPAVTSPVRRTRPWSGPCPPAPPPHRRRCPLPADRKHDVIGVVMMLQWWRLTLRPTDGHTEGNRSVKANRRFPSNRSRASPRQRPRK